MSVEPTPRRPRRARALVVVTWGAAAMLGAAACASGGGAGRRDRSPSVATDNTTAPAATGATTRTTTTGHGEVALEPADASGAMASGPHDTGAAAPGTARQADAPRPAARPRPSRANRQRLTADELRAGHWQTLYDAVQALRGRWLAPRAPGGALDPGVIVYMDNARIGGVESLRRIAPTGIAWIRWVEGAQAGARWGIGHTQGVIYVASQGMDQMAVP